MKWTIKKGKAISTKGLTKDLIDKFSVLNGAKYFSLGIFQNYLVFTPARKYIKCFTSTTRVESWKSNGISEERIKNITLFKLRINEIKQLFKI